MNRTSIAGYSLIDNQYKTNAATFFVTLTDFKERYASAKKAMRENAKAVLKAVYAGSQEIRTGRVLPIAPPAIPGIGTTGGFEFWVRDKGSGDPSQLYELTQQIILRARQRPELADMNSTFRASSRQLRVDVDREKAVLLGVPVQYVYSTLQARFGSLAVSRYNQHSRVWSIILQSDAKYRQDPADITRLYVRSHSGEMVPFAALVSTHSTTGPDLLPRFNGFPAAQITGNASAGYSSGDAIAAMETVAREILAQGYDFAWSGMAYEEKKSGGTLAAPFYSA